jgi:ribulose-bisphosphate carboxylase large chain
VDDLYLGEEVDPEAYVLCRYSLETDLPLEEAAGYVAAEQSTGTWTKTTTETDEIRKAYGAKVLQIERRGAGTGSALIAVPVEDFSLPEGGIPQILSLVAGNVFGLEAVRNLRLEEIRFPRTIVRHFRGAKFGIAGLRKRLKRREGLPFIGTIVKPKIGMPPEKYGEYVYEAGMGGLTNSKDDETLVDQAFCPILERVRHTAEALDRVEEEAGHRMLHAVNITTRCDRLLELADRVIEAGARQLMVDVLTAGFTSVQALAEDPSIRVPLHIHRAMHAAITKNPKHGIAMPVFATLVRMAGGDSLHIGTFGVGKMAGEPEEDIASQGALTGDLYGLKDPLPVCSGGMHPGVVGSLLRRTGTDVQIQAGGGVSGHPGGVRKGAVAMVQAVEAFLAGVTAEAYAETHPELEDALEAWKGLEKGYRKKET